MIGAMDGYMAPNPIYLNEFGVTHGTKPYIFIENLPLVCPQSGSDPTRTPRDRTYRWPALKEGQTQLETREIEPAVGLPSRRVRPK